MCPTSPHICHQQCIVCLVCHLILWRDMSPVSGTLSEWHHTCIDCYQPGPRACSRCNSVLGLFWSDLESLIVSLADRILVDGYLGSWTKSQFTTEATPISMPLRKDVQLVPCQTIEACAMLASVDTDEAGHYWGAMHGAQLLWRPVRPLLLCASKQVVL